MCVYIVVNLYGINNNKKKETSLFRKFCILRQSFYILLVDISYLWFFSFSLSLYYDQRWNSGVKLIPLDWDFPQDIPGERFYIKISIGLKASMPGERSRGIDMTTFEFHLSFSYRNRLFKRRSPKSGRKRRRGGVGGRGKVK